MVRLKDKYKNTVIAFGASSRPLGERQDINELAIAAIQSGDKTLLELFEELPPIEELLNWRFEQKLKSVKIK